jgi:hypothetical protein
MISNYYNASVIGLGTVNMIESNTDSPGTALIKSKHLAQWGNHGNNEDPKIQII